MSSHLPIVAVLAASVIVQATAAVLALRLILLTRRRAAWGFIALALVLMAVRRAIPLHRLLAGDASRPPDLLAEVVGLVLSTAMTAGIALIAPIFNERKRAEDDVRRLNLELDRRVKERTAELETANRELESYSYSISHDMRAPLRHVDGYLALLQERLGPKLDEEGRRCIARVSEAARKMGALIDDFVSFCRIGRVEMASGRVSLAALVQQVVRELEPQARGRAVDWRIGELPEVAGDRVLLRILLESLLSNALKFTRARATAVIEIGCAPGQDGETVLSVRDNGVGFNPEYAQKIFGVFQRLHRAEEYEGTGIGLAIAARVVKRHGGRIWAEGRLDAGATFYCALPPAAGAGLVVHRPVP